MEERGLKIIPGILAGTGLFGASFLLRSQYERDCLSTEEFVIHSRKIKGAGKTFVFLSDLHDKEFGAGNQKLLAAVRRAKPDAVLIGGDMMVAKGKADLTVSLGLLEALSKEWPVYCGNGNHEARMRRETDRYGALYREYRHALREMGICCLCDQSVSFGEDIEIYGLDLPDTTYHSSRPRLPKHYLERVLGPGESDRFAILLAHSPCFFREYAGWGADLTLAGHFHGGTIRLPLLGGVMTPQYQFFYPWCGGCFHASGEFPGEFEAEQEHTMIVSRGLGTHSVNIRFNNKPQVVVVKILNPTIF